jgi:hypothetical protein
VNIGYHTRLWTNNEKIAGGSFGGQIDMDTVERLTKAFFTVEVLNGGTPVFVDRNGRVVRLYLSVDAASTDIGKAELRVWRNEQERLEQEETERRSRQDAVVENLMADLSHEEIVRRLKGGAG